MNSNIETEIISHQRKSQVGPTLHKLNMIYLDLPLICKFVYVCVHACA